MTYLTGMIVSKQKEIRWDRHHLLSDVTGWGGEVIPVCSLKASDQQLKSATTQTILSNSAGNVHLNVFTQYET